MSEVSIHEVCAEGPIVVELCLLTLTTGGLSATGAGAGGGCWSGAGDGGDRGG